MDIQNHHVTQDKKNQKIKISVLAIIFWIAIWQLFSIIIDSNIRLASPLSVLIALIRLGGQYEFWISIFNSFQKIVKGFAIAIIIGTLLSMLSYSNIWFREIISPMIKIIKAIPVASFVILSLLWVKSKNLSILISFLMVVPIIYTNTLEGLQNTDKKLLEMAKVFKINPIKKIRYIYVPEVIPYFISAATVSLGFCWKAGIAAEVIGLPKSSIGEKLYEAKLYLMTDELFAWTIVIVIISVIFEKLVMWFVNFIKSVIIK